MINKDLIILYRNYRGVVDARYIRPERIEYATTEWHGTAWVMWAYDYGKRAKRVFCLTDILASVPVEGADLSVSEKLVYEGLLEAQRLAHKTATDAGWYTNPVTGEELGTRNFGEVVALMHSELSEALEADRKGLMDDKLPDRNGIEVEFADCIIRILDTSAARDLDVPGAFVAKNRYNRNRADHKIENRAKAKNTRLV